MTSYQSIETPQDYVNYTFNIGARGITEVAGEMAGLSNTITTIMGQLAFKTAEYLTHTETLMMGIGTTAIASFASATKEAMKFEQAIANVQAIGGESINAVDIGQAAMKYSNQFAMDVNSMTEGLEALSRAGLTATDIMSGVLAEGVKLSKLEGMDLEDSINDLIATTNLLAEEHLDVNTQEYADAVKAMNQHIVSTSESAPINAQNIIQSLQHVGGYASANKIDQDDLFAVIAQLGAKGTKGEMAGTALRAFIAAGQKDQAQRALARIGLNVSDLWDASGNAMLPVSEMKQVLDDALEARGYSKQEKLEFYSDFAGYKQANQIMKIDVSEVQQYKETISQAWDLGKKLEVILGTTHSQVQILFQTVKNFMTRTGAQALKFLYPIITVLKWGMQLLDAMPFSENITGMLLAFGGLKAALLFINRVVPSIASLYTSFSNSEKKAEGISGHFYDIYENLKKSKDILSHLNDPQYLSRIRLQDGVMGEQSYRQHKDITRVLYSKYREEDPANRLPWDELSSVQKDIYNSITEAYKGTDAYKKILQEFQDANNKHIDEFGDFLIKDDTSVKEYKESVRRMEVGLQPSNIDRNKEIALYSNDDIKEEAQNVTKAIEELTTKISDSKNENDGILELSDSQTETNIINAILKTKSALSEAIGRSVSQSLRTKDVHVSETLGSFQMDGRQASGIKTQLLSIEEKVSNELGDIGHFLDDDLEKIDILRAKVHDDLQKKITSYSNDNPNFMNHTQSLRMKKSITRDAKTQLGLLYSSEQNNIDILNILKNGKWNKPKDERLGVRNAQLDAIESTLGMKNGSNKTRDERINNIHKFLQHEYKGNKDAIIDKILQETEKIWLKEEKEKDLPSVVASKHLTDARAQYIGNNLGLGGINWSKIDNPAQELVNYFKDVNTDKTKQKQLNDASKIMLGFMEQSKKDGDVFNEAEAEEIGYLIRRYKQLLVARNKAIEKANNATLKPLDDKTIGPIVRQKRDIKIKSNNDIAGERYNFVKDIEKRIHEENKDKSYITKAMKELNVNEDASINKKNLSYEHMSLNKSGNRIKRIMKDFERQKYEAEEGGFNWSPITGAKISDLQEVLIVHPVLDDIRRILPSIDENIKREFNKDNENNDEFLYGTYDISFIPSLDNLSKIPSMLDNLSITFNDTIGAIGDAAITGDIRLNPARLQVGDSFTGLISTYMHELGHVVLGQQHNNYIGDFSNIESLGYEGALVVNEAESELFAQRILKNLNIPIGQYSEVFLNAHTSALKENDLYDNVRIDLIEQMADMLTANQNNLIQLLAPLKYALDQAAHMNIGYEEFFKTNSTKVENLFLPQFFRQQSNNGFGTHIFTHDDFGEGTDEEEEWKRLQALENEVIAWEDKQRSAPMESDKNIKSQCCSEIKKFLQTITQHLSDYTKFFAKTDTQLVDIIDLLSEIAEKEDTTIVNNISNTLIVFQHNMEQGIKGLPQGFSDAIKSTLLPSSTIKEEDIFEVKALIVEDVEKAILMIDTAYIAPQNVTNDDGYKESNISLSALYDEIYGPEQPQYDTPPLLTSLLALPEKIQEVTTDFILLGEAIDLSKQALEEYLLKTTNLLMLPQGSPKGYHNAYPENAGIFSPLPTDTLTPTKNIYLQRAIKEPYNVTENQLRSVGLNGLVPIWQQNLKRFTPYDSPIGPKPDNTDLGKYKQYLAIEEENRKNKKQQEAQAEASLQAREEDRLIGITERYNEKMAQRKERLDALAKIQNQRYQNFKQEKENLLQLAFAYDIINRAEEKREKLKNIDYRRYKNNYSFNQGRVGYYNYLNDIGLKQFEEDKRNQELISGYNQIPQKPTTKEEIEDILINNRADKESIALLEQLDNTIKELHKAIADRNVEKHILQIVGAYTRSDYGEPMGPLTYEEYVKQSLQSMKEFFAEDRQKQRDREYDKQIVDIIDKNFITQNSGYIPTGVPTSLQQASQMKESQEYITGLGIEEMVNFYKKEEELREEEHNRIIENENARAQAIENERNIRNGLNLINQQVNEAETKIQRTKQNNINKEKLLIDEIKRKFATGLYVLTDEELQKANISLIYSQNAHSKGRADAMQEKRQKEQQEAFKDAQRIGTTIMGMYSSENIFDAQYMYEQSQKDNAKRKEEKNKESKRQKEIIENAKLIGMQISGIYDMESESDYFWANIEKQEQEAALSKAEQANAAVERYRRHQKTLQKQIKYQLKKEIEIMNGLSTVFNNLADEAEKASKQESNPMRKQEEKRRKKVDRESFWAEQEQLEQEGIHEAKIRQEAQNIAEQLGPQLLETMKHQLGFEKERDDRRKENFEQSRKDLLNIANNIKEQDIRADRVRAQYSYISGTNVNAEYEGLSDTEKATMKADHKYGKVSSDRKQSWGERAERFGIKLGTVKESFFDGVSNIADKYPEEQANKYAESIGEVSDKIEKGLQPMRDLSDGLQRASEVFPPFAIAASGLNTIIGIGEGVVWALNLAETVLNAEKTFDTLVTWGLITAEQAETLSKGVATIATWGLTTAIGVLETVMLPLVAVVLAVVAAIEILKFAEKQHANALKEAQEELQKATSKSSIALSQYKDLKKARENETDAIKKQQAARKEAIALYELEAARIKQRKAIHDEAKLRNDAIWGEYGLRASLQKMGLGFIAGGDFQSQYENYDGTTANIRQIKEGTLGNLFATSEQRYVASVYDKNSMFFAEVEAYQKPLQELYDKESKLIEQYGSIDLARGTKEFEDAVQEFADATGINGETAVKMLEWLETENKVNQATKVGQAQINMIRARADAKVMGLEFSEGGDLNDMDTLGNAMVLAQFQQMMNEAKTEVWWELLYAYLDTLISIMLPWKWGDVGKNLATIGIRQEELSELDAEGNNILNSMYEQYEDADRRDYGNGGVSYGDTPFGWALEADATQYAIEQQEQSYLNNGHIMSDEEFLNTQSEYSENKYGITNEQLKQQKTKEEQEAYAKAQQNKKDKKADTTLGQLQNNGEQAHNDAMAIIDAIKNPGVASGLGAGISKLVDDSLFESLSKFSLDDIFGFMRGESGTFTERIRNVAQNAKNTYSEGKWKGVIQYGRDWASQGVERIKGASPNAIERAKSAISRGRGALSDLWYGKEVATGRVKVNIGGPTTPIMERTGGLRGVFEGARGAYAEGRWRGLGQYGKGLATQGIEKIKGVSPNAVERAKGAISRGKGALSSGISGLKSEIAGARDINGWVKSGGLEMERTLFQRGVGAFDDVKGALTLSNIKGVGPNAVSRAQSALSRGKGIYSELGGARGLASSVSTEVNGIKGLASSTASNMQTLMNPKGFANGIDDIAKGMRGGGTLMQGIGKVGGRALAFLGPALAFAGKASELNPFEGKHYNEDGTEKKALQATGEVVGTTAGALGGVAGGLAGAEAGAALGATIGSVIPGVGTVIGGALGAVAGGIAGGWLGDTIFQPIGDAIGGTIGWLGDNLLGGIQNVAGTVWDGLTGAAGGVWDAVSGAATGVWDFITGGGDGNQPIGGLLGLSPIGMGVNAAAGIWDWLSGGSDKNVEYGDGLKAGKQAKESIGNGNTIVIKNININTEDDPEKIKTAFMNLMIELEEQITPRQVSRIVGEPSSSSIPQDANADANTDTNDSTQNLNSNSNNNPT